MKVHLQYRHRQGVNMKRGLIFLIVLATLLTLCSCRSNSPSGNLPATNGGENLSEVPQSPLVDVKGIFLLEPSADLDLSADNLDSIQRYFFVVYDVASVESNQLLSGRDDSIELTLNGTNTYGQLDKYDGEVLGNFLENCGYAVSTSYGTLWSGTDPVRMIAAFAINKNDIRDDCEIKLEFNLSDDISSSAEYNNADIQTIDWMDDVFAVEENPDAYQIARSCGVRAKICKQLLENASEADHNRQFTMRDIYLSSLEVMLAEDTVWGVSCSSAVGDVMCREELPIFKVDSVRIYYPEIADKIVTIRDCLETMTTGLKQESPDYDNINSAQSLAYNTLIEIIDCFNN